MRKPLIGRESSDLQRDRHPILPDRKRQAFLFRTDPDLLDALRRWADDELRSANAQLEFILREALRRAGRLPRSDPARRKEEPPRPKQE